MHGEILVELDDLLRAERELTDLLARLRTDEKEAISLYARSAGLEGALRQCFKKLDRNLL
ncbi:Uncharacterised protein [Actinobacillus pleuropneumoniae]|jgi:hypothetical protein|nr:Uncharacterised protein [Actinobacillus pleuropneumoniae]